MADRKQRLKGDPNTLKLRSGLDIRDRGHQRGSTLSMRIESRVKAA
jgi:hypothetical protein